MRYSPALSVTADRVFSMSTGLDASTVTPGSTAPDVSLTTPVIDAWARAVAGRTRNQARSVDALTSRCTLASFTCGPDRVRGSLVRLVHHVNGNVSVLRNEHWLTRGAPEQSVPRNRPARCRVSLQRATRAARRHRRGRHERSGRSSRWSATLRRG